MPTLSHHHPHERRPECHCIACNPLQRPCTCDHCEELVTARYCHVSNDVRHACARAFNCCDCGGTGCGCAYCWSCHACRACNPPKD